MVIHSFFRSTCLLATGQWRTGEQGNKDDLLKSDLHVRNVFAFYALVSV